MWSAPRPAAREGGHRGLLYYSGLDWRYHYQKVVEAEKALRQRHIPAGANTVPMTEALENDLRDLGSRALSLADEILDASMYGQWSPYNM